MDPSRKRRIRLFVAFTAALLLGGALVYTSFSSATEARTPSQVVNAGPGESYELTGKVVEGSIRRDGERTSFRIRDRDGATSVPVEYTGVVPDPFRDGREVIVTGEMRGGTFVAERDSLVTKCPSKFENAEDGRAR